MDDALRRDDGVPGLLRIEDCLDADGGVALPPGVNLISLIDRNIANVGDTVAYRYLDYSGSDDGTAHEVTWSQFGVRLEAIGARIQQVASRGERVAVLAPQGIDYVAGFYAAVKAGTIAVPLFAPELPGHAERLDTALRDSQPSVLLTTTVARDAVEQFLAGHPHLHRPRVIAIDEIPDSAAESFAPTDLGMDDVSHLQYTSGSTRPPVGVEITHRAVGTNLVQMILSIDLLDRNTHGVSWLPLYHDMGLSMIGFPAVYGGHSTLMSPAAFVRRPQRWIKALSDGSRHGNVVTAAPNFAYEWAAQRAAARRRRGHRPAQRGDDHRLRTGQHGCDPDVQQGVRSVRVAADGVQAVLRHRGGDAVRCDHRAAGRGDGGVFRPPAVGRRTCGAGAGQRPRCRRRGVLWPGGAE